MNSDSLYCYSQERPREKHPFPGQKKNQGILQDKQKQQQQNFIASQANKLIQNSSTCMKLTNRDEKEEKRNYRYHTK